MFRVAPNLRQIHPVLAGILEESGIDSVVVLEGDWWSSEIRLELSKTLGEGRVRFVRYNKTETDFGMTIGAAALELRNLEKSSGPGRTAVVLACSGEEQNILRTASRVDGLLDAPWIVLGESEKPLSIVSDLSHISTVSRPPKARIISVRMAPITENEVFDKLRFGYMATEPQEGDRPFGVMEASFRDSLWVACLSVLRTNSTDGNVLKDVVPTVASEIQGASGRIYLDLNGDRLVDWDIFDAISASSGATWIKVGEYDAQTGKTNVEGILD
jgi:hypothetical protein